MGGTGSESAPLSDAGFSCLISSGSVTQHNNLSLSSKPCAVYIVLTKSSSVITNGSRQVLTYVEFLCRLLFVYWPQEHTSCCVVVVTLFRGE
jgi:hypothetical protein